MKLIKRKNKKKKKKKKLKKTLLQSYYPWRHRQSVKKDGPQLFKKRKLVLLSFILPVEENINFC